MNHTSDTAAGNGDTFSPQQAAALLDEATWQARRKLVPNPPWVLVTRGVLVLAACVYSGASVAVVGAVGLLATPAAAWLVAGVGLCAALSGGAALTARGQRA
jgi:hypothetical protein